MERSERLLDLLGEIDPAAVAAVRLTPAPRRRTLRKWLPAVACLCLCTVLGTALLRGSLLPGATEEAEDMTVTSNARYPAAELIPGADGTDPEHGNLQGVIPYMTTGATYPRISVTWDVTWGEGNYTVANSSRRLARMMLGERLGEAEAAHVSPSSTDTHAVTCYRLLGISEQVAIGVIFDGQEDIYVYSNERYVPATMAALFDEMGLWEYLSLRQAGHTRVEGEELVSTVYLDGGTVMAAHLLRQMMDAAPVQVNASGIAPAARPAVLEIEAGMEMFGFPSCTLTVYENGYLVLPLLGNNYVFRMDEALLSDCLAVLAQACEHREQRETVPVSYGNRLSTSPTLPEVYNKLTVAGITYECATCEYGIDAARVGERLGEMKAGVAEAAPTVTYHRLIGVSEKCAIAVRFGDGTRYYSYYNPDYRPETLGALIDEMGLETYLRMGNPTVSYRDATITQTARFTDSDSALTWAYLLSDRAAENVAAGDSRMPDPNTVRVRIPLTVPLLTGNAEYTLWLTEDGSLVMDLLGCDLVFRPTVGEEEMAKYIFSMVFRFPNCGLKVEDSVSHSSGLPWEDAPLYERYSGFEAAGSVYAATGERVDPARVGERLGEARAVGADPASRMLYHAPVTYHALQGNAYISEVAVRFEGEDGWYLYTNRAYIPDTLGGFLAQTGWASGAVLTDCIAYVKGMHGRNVTLRFPDADPALMHALLFAAAEAPNVAKRDGTRRGDGGSVLWQGQVTRPNGTVSEIVAYVYADGYLTFYLDGDRNVPYCFAVGKERTDVFLDHLMEDCLAGAAVQKGTLLLGAGETAPQTIARLMREKLGREE